MALGKTLRLDRNSIDLGGAALPGILAQRFHFRTYILSSKSIMLKTHDGIFSQKLQVI